MKKKKNSQIDKHLYLKLINEKKKKQKEKTKPKRKLIKFIVYRISINNYNKWTYSMYISQSKHLNKKYKIMIKVKQKKIVN